ncbi:MAG: tRNA(Met) cytidine acetyltransferase TmcA [Archaeoglobaceae archaeon]|nr:tRNA(Met) cytidine acetyltransferase TmcA [Archaeoglobaceae archaeon]MDW8118310.1 tRNA(Met) cytidine acetyltransferase TmcA [Archaeoglobaceae archaeon]
MEELFQEISKARKIAIENGHRFMVFICSSSLEKAVEAAEKVYSEHRKMLEKDNLLVVGREAFLEIAKDKFNGNIIHWKNSFEILGATFSSLIIDLSEGFHPNDLGIVVETVGEGGIIVAISPQIERWKNLKSKWHEELVSEPYSVNDVIGRFYRRFLERTLKAEGVIIYDLDKGEIVKKFEFVPKGVSREEIVLPESTKIKKKLYKLCATQDQVRVLQLFERFFERERDRKAVVITADRGRGKTAVLGIVTPALVSRLERLLKRPIRVLIVAPTPHAVQNYFRFLIKAMKRQGMKEFFIKKTDEELITVLNSKYARIEYAIPRRALEEKEFADILIVDESAGIEVPVLFKIIEGFRHVIFSTTIHGYEGTGRSFNVRFLKKLEEDQSIELEKIHMSEPIRYGIGDPIESWLYDALLLNAQPAEIGKEEIEKIKNLELEFEVLEKEELLSNEKLLREFFGIYVLAHYRNRPSDLAVLLDTPNHIPAVVKVNGKVVCSLHLAVEGGMDDQLIGKIREGYKPRGQIIPDLVLKHFWNYEFSRRKGVRIVRIAVHPSAMDIGIGSFALKKTIEWADKNDLEWVGSGFGVSNELIRFWLKNGFVPVHMTPQRNEVSGEYTIIVLRSIRVDESVEKMNIEFIRRFIEYLSDELSDLETETAILILKSLKGDVECTPPKFRELEVERITKYFEGLGFYEYISDIARPLVRFYYSNVDKNELEEREEQILVAKCLQLRSWRDIGGEEKYKTLLNALKKVWEWFLSKQKIINSQS